jgi:hypothetical protein
MDEEVFTIKQRRRVGDWWLPLFDKNVSIEEKRRVIREQEEQFGVGGGVLAVKESTRRDVVDECIIRNDKSTLEFVQANTSGGVDVLNAKDTKGYPRFVRYIRKFSSATDHPVVLQRMIEWGVDAKAVNTVTGEDALSVVRARNELPPGWLWWIAKACGPEAIESNTSLLYRMVERDEPPEDIREFEYSENHARYVHPDEEKMVLHAAAYSRISNIIELLFSRMKGVFSEQLAVKDKKGRAPLLIAIQVVNVQAIRSLLENGASPTSTYTYYEHEYGGVEGTEYDVAHTTDILGYCIKKGLVSTEVLKLMLARVPSVSYFTGKEYLHDAIMYIENASGDYIGAFVSAGYVPTKAELMLAIDTAETSGDESCIKTRLEQVLYEIVQYAMPKIPYTQELKQQLVDAFTELRFFRSLDVLNMFFGVELNTSSYEESSSSQSSEDFPSYFSSSGRPKRDAFNSQVKYEAALEHWLAQRKAAPSPRILEQPHQRYMSPHLPSLSPPFSPIPSTLPPTPGGPMSRLNFNTASPPLASRTVLLFPSPGNTPENGSLLSDSSSSSSSSLYETNTPTRRLTREQIICVGCGNMFSPPSSQSSFARITCSPVCEEYFDALKTSR